MLACHILRIAQAYIWFRYFTLTTSDLEEWDHDAEAFYHEQDMVQWKDKLRPCAESLYLILFEKYREVRCILIILLLCTHMTDME